MKKLCSMFVFVLILTLLPNTIAFAGTKPSTKVKVTVNKKTVHYDDATPYVKNKQAMIPLKETLDAINSDTKWTKTDDVVWASLGMMHIKLTIGEKKYYIYRDADFTGIPETITLETTIKETKGSIFVPGKQFLESIGMKVNWNSKTRLLSITDNSLVGKKVDYTVISEKDIANIKKLKGWYDQKNQKQGIFYRKSGKSIYVLIGAGEKTTGGYSIKIEDAYYESADTVFMSATITPPGNDVNVIMMLTYPSILMRIDSDTINTVTGAIADNNFQ